MRGVTSVIVQTHQILRLPRKMNLMIDPCHTWNAIYNARSNNCHCPNSPNTAPATKNESHDWSLSHMKRYLQCAEQQVSLSKLTKYCACHAKWLSKILQNFLENSWNVISNAGPIREWSEHDPSNIRAGNRPPQPASQQRWLFALATSIFYWKMQHFALRLSFQISPNTAPATKSDSSTSPNTAPATQSDCHDWSSSHMKCHLQCAEQPVSSSNITEYCACHAKWISWLVLVTHETLFTMRGVTTVIAQTHQILRLPRKMNLMIDPCHTWNAIYNARSNRWHPPTSPCQMILQNFRNISPKQMKRQLQCATDPRPFREWSENDPRMKPSLRNPPRNRGYFSRPPQAFCIEKYNTSRSGYHSKFHQILRLPRKVTLQLHQILRLPRKMTLMINPRHTWNAIYNARNNMWHPPTSPNTAPAMPNDSPKFQKHFSKTDETSITMRDRSETIPRMIREWSENETVTPQPASQPRLLFTPTTGILYWKIQHFALRLSFQISPNTAPATKSDTSTPPNTAPATQNDSHDQSATHLKRYLQCAEQQVASSNITKYCACHAKWFSKISETFLQNRWNVNYNARPIRDHSENDPRMIREWNRHSATRLATEVTFHAHHRHFVLKNTTFRAPAIIPNFTEYCACHEKWHFNFTEYCACHEKWHLNVTK